MSALSEAVSALREAMRLTDEVRQAGESLKAIAQELREHDRRITRLEAKWETAMELAALQGGRPLPPERRE